MNHDLKAIIVTAAGFQDHEVVYPYFRLKGAGFSVSLVSDSRDSRGRCYGLFGTNMPCDLTYEEFASSASEMLAGYHLLVIPGGVKALEKVRLDENIVQFVSDWNSLSKPIASTCSGAQLLITANAVSGKTIAAYYAMKADVENAGAKFSSDPVVVSGNIVSSPHYDFLGEWMEAVLVTLGSVSSK